MQVPRYAARSTQLGELQDTFLISAVGMILVIRLQLWLTNYPQLGSGKLHIAHLLWGGLLMLLAIGLLLTIVGRRWRRPAAILGGAGFGFFIDEVGKFVTSDNDYFYKPTAAIIYVTFIGLYFLARWIRERRGVSEREYLANALDILAGAAPRELDARDKRAVLEHLDRSGEHAWTPSLRAIVDQIPEVTRAPSRAARAAAAVVRTYERACGTRWFRRLVIAVFALFGALNIAGWTLAALAALASLTPLDFDFTLKLTVAQVGETASDLATTALVCIGLARLRAGRVVDGYRMLERAVLVELFIGQVFAFIDRSFVAVWGFLVALALLLVVRFMIRQEVARERGGGRDPDLIAPGPAGVATAPQSIPAAGAAKLR